MEKEVPKEDQELYNQSFMDKPDILQKHQAAAVVCNGKCLFLLAECYSLQEMHQLINLSIYSRP